MNKEKGWKGHSALFCSWGVHQLCWSNAFLDTEGCLPAKASYKQSVLSERKRCIKWWMTEGCRCVDHFIPVRKNTLKILFKIRDHRNHYLSANWHASIFVFFLGWHTTLQSKIITILLLLLIIIIIHGSTFSTPSLRYSNMKWRSLFLTYSKWVLVVQSCT